MFTVSDEALEKMKRFHEGVEYRRPIRVLMTEGDWKGPHLVMALDERIENEAIFTAEGVIFVIEEELFERVKPINIGYTHSTLGDGYTLDSELMKDAKDVNSGCHEICGSCETAPR
jgi:Fe-S cluster assembly iron-binding protein IscA